MLLDILDKELIENKVKETYRMQQFDLDATEQNHFLYTRHNHTKHYYFKGTVLLFMHDKHTCP